MNKFDCICPIWIEDETGIPEFLGSSTLLDICGVKLLVTAAHVVDESASSTLYWNPGGKLIPLVGRFDTSSLPQSGKRDDDPIDIAVLELSEELAASLSVVAPKIRLHHFKAEDEQSDGF